MDSAPRFVEILTVLARHEVELILVGGVAAIIEGAPVSTFDLDIVVLKTAENMHRLLPALRELDARYLDPAGRHIVPDADHHPFGLETIILSKEQANRDKDRATLPILRRTLQLKQESAGSEGRGVSKEP